MNKTIFEETISKRCSYWLIIFALIIIALVMVGCLLLINLQKDNIWIRMIKLFPPILIAIVIYLWQQYRYYFLVYRKFNGAVFNVHPKRTRLKKPLRKVELIAHKNKILFRYMDEPTYEGEIVLDLFNLRYGKGTHSNNVNIEIDDEKDFSNNNDYEHNHENVQVKSDQFGFAQFIVTENKIYVEHPYVKPDKERPPYGAYLYQATVWIRESCKST